MRRDFECGCGVGLWGSDPVGSGTFRQPQSSPTGLQSSCRHHPAQDDGDFARLSLAGMLQNLEVKPPRNLKLIPPEMFRPVRREGTLRVSVSHEWEREVTAEGNARPEVLIWWCRRWGWNPHSPKGTGF